jgi:mannose-6-phosphate isomerase
MSDIVREPLVFEPIFKQKVWGGRTLERVGRALPDGPETPIGESWEIADLPSTDPGGGGGGEAQSRVRKGPHKGRTLRSLQETDPEGLLGTAPRSENDGFPLLIKFLDARENLSVQVHPSPEYARAHPEARLKSEAWYVVAAEPGAVLYEGLAEGVTPEAIRRALAENTEEAVTPLLRRVPVRAGDCHYLPSGTCHALGAGLVVAEVQTPGDTTFRVFDWGREGRELHVEQALASMRFEPPTAPPLRERRQPAPAGVEIRPLVDCEHFSMARWVAGEGGATFRREPADEARIWMLLSGGLRVQPEAGGESLETEALDTVLLPASLPPAEIRLGPNVALLEIVPRAGA